MARFAGLTNDGPIAMADDQIAPFGEYTHS
jgi:hypothetical protein